MASIASLETIGSEFDTGAKFFRLLAKEGTTISHLQRVIDSAAARRNLAAYLGAGCPKLGSANATPVPEAPKSSGLRPVEGSIELGPVKSHDPAQFYRTRSGLHVWPEFNSPVLSRARKVESLEATSLQAFDLTKSLYDRDIKALLPENHVFHDESELCARIEQMVSKQPNGEKGNLLANGYANLFYLPGCVVSVIWSADDRKWNVYAWKLDGGYRYAGCRVFSRN